MEEHLCLVNQVTPVMVDDVRGLSHFNPMRQRGEVDMQTAIMIATVVAIVALAEIGMARWSSVERVAEVVSTVDVDRRFAIKFCYRQYTNQTDVNHCLLRNARLTPGQSR
jgi:hypothetical protein